MTISKPSNDPSDGRRRQPRRQVQYPAVVRGVAPDGKKFQVRATVHNLSAGGLYIQMGQAVEVGAVLEVNFRLSSAALGREKAPSITASAIVVWIKSVEDGTFGIGLRLLRNEFT